MAAAFRDRRWARLLVLMASASTAYPPCNLSHVLAALAPGTPALRKYTAAVYGVLADDGARALHELAFYDKLECCVEILWVDYLPPELSSECRWRRFADGYGAVYSRQNPFDGPERALWIYRQRALECKWARNQPKPTPRAPEAFDAEREWVEVVHRFSDNPFEREAMYMYRAVGSGVWYRLGRTLNARSRDGLMRLAGKRVLPKALAWARAAGFDSVSLSQTCERWSRDYKLEILALFEPSQIANASTLLLELCPTRFAAGPHAALRPCSCCAARPGDGRAWCPELGARAPSSALGPARQRLALGVEPQGRQQEDGRPQDGRRRRRLQPDFVLANISSLPVRGRVRSVRRVPQGLGGSTDAVLAGPRDHAEEQAAATDEQWPLALDGLFLACDV